MMTAATDASLLTAFARHRDEKAFRALAERHFGLVFHTALRRTGNRALAEDVSQEVLCILARKAVSLASHPDRLPSWLHRTTLFECTTAMRKEKSQQRRLERAHLEEESAAMSAHLLQQDSALWQRALPYLDLALDKLPEADRRVLLLHFFESLSFPRIAALLGKSPAAVQKQSVRALDKLARLLRTGKTAVPVTVLAAGLAAESAKAAPLGLIPAFTTHALTTTTGMSGLSVMIATHQKILIPLSLLLLSAPLVLQQLAVANAEHRLATLEKPATFRQPHSGFSAIPGRTGGTQISGSLSISTLENEAWLASRAASLLPPLRRKLQALDTPQLAKLLRSHDIRDTTFERGSPLAVLLADVIGARDHREALSALLDAGWKGTSEPKNQFMVWLKTDPEDAERWLMETQQRPDIAKELSRNSQRSFGPDTEEIPRNGGSVSIGSMQGALLLHLVANDPEEARRYLASFPPDSWQPDIIAEALFRQPHAGGVEQETARNYLRIIRENLHDNLYPIGLRSLINSIGSPANLDAWVQMPDLSAEERREVAEAAARALLKRAAAPSNPYSEGMEPHLETAEEWLLRSAPDLAAPVIRKVAPEVAAKIEERENSLLEQLADQHNSHDPDDQIAASLQNKRFIYHLPEALKAAEKIQSPTVRAQTLWHLEHFNP